MHEEIIECFKKIDLFSNLEDAELKLISKAAFIKNYQKGTIVFFQGDPGEGMFVIKDGKVKITKENEDGKEQILHFMGQGDVFAEVVLFDERPYPATAEVIENSSIVVISKKDFHEILIDYPKIALKMLRLMGKRLRYAQSQVADLALKDAHRRTASMIYKLQLEHGKETMSGSIKIDLSITHQQLGNMIGTSRETVTRILNKLKEEGVIDFEKNFIIITQPEKLKEETIIL